MEHSYILNIRQPETSHTATLPVHNNAMKKLLAIFLLILLLPGTSQADLEAHFLDVGQGDCAIILCDGEAMVIDGGPKSASSLVYSYIRNTLDRTQIDYVISTHPHIDHVGGLAAVLNAAQVDLLLTPVTKWESEAFKDMIKYAEEQGTYIDIPNQYDTMKLGGATVTILLCWPDAIQYGRTNDSSIVLRIDYGNTSFLFTGDAEEWAEEMLLQDQVNLHADVLKVAHHGSPYSSSARFLQEIAPKYAVISVGKGNRYNHPSEDVLSRLQESGAVILRTDELGTIIIKSNGTALSITY